MTTRFKNSKRLFQNASKAEVVSCQGLSTPDASGRCPEMQKRSICTARKDTWARNALMPMICQNSNFHGFLANDFITTDINRIDILASQDQCVVHSVSRFNAFQQSLFWGLSQQHKQNLTRTQPEKLPHPPFRPRVHPKPPGKMVGGAYIV